MEWLLAPTPLGLLLERGLMTPLGIPVAIILIDSWRYKKRTIAWMTAGLLAFFAAGYAALYLTLGNTALTRALVGWATPAISWGLLVLFTRRRGGRLLFSAITAWLLAMATDLLASILSPPGSPLWLICKVGFTLAEVLVFAFVLKRPYHRMLRATRRGWVQMSVLPLSIQVGIGVSFFRPLHTLGVQPDPTVPLILCVSGLFIYLALYQLVMAVREQHMASRDNDVLKTQMRFMEQQAGMADENLRESRTFRHDMRHYLGLLRACIRQGNTGEADEILRSMERELDRLSGQYAIIPYTGEAIIDTVLSLAAQRARQAGVGFEVDLAWPQALQVDRIRFAVVLSNALDNAMNACLREPAGSPRRIRVQGITKPKQFFLSIGNTCTAPVRLDKKTGLPLSEDDEHGYGTHSIAGFAKSCNALLRYSAQDGWFTLALLLLLE